MTPTAVRAVRAVAGVRGVYGLLLLARTREVLTRVHGVPAGQLELAVLRVLGARHVGQALLTLAVPSDLVVRAGIGADLLHGATGALLAAASPTYRRAGLVELTTASTFAAAAAAARKFPV